MRESKSGASEAVTRATVLGLAGGQARQQLVSTKGWPEGEDECILEFATDTISGIEADTHMARD